MSLCATGMPVSGPPSRFAMRASAARAPARLTFSSTVMKALSSPSRCAMRSKQSRVSSTAEIFLAARAAPSSARLWLSTLLNHFRYQVQGVVDRRRERLVKRVPVGLGDLVRAQSLDQLERMRHWNYAGGIDPAHLVDQAEDTIQARMQRCRLLRPDGDAGKPCDAADLVVGKRHENCGECYRLEPRPGGGFPLFPSPLTGLF